MLPIESIPNAEKTFSALRSLGYDLNSSIADVVDNAITEKVRARNISVIFERRKSRFICRIQDDGPGMPEKELEEAMRIGADASYGARDLGKFGMGMKTASLSHCNILTVVSRTKKGELSGYRWDMTHVRGTQKWSLLKLDRKDIDNLLSQEGLKIQDSGTIVCWDDLYLLDEEYKSYASPKLAESYYYRILGNLKLHLSMVFHRFLDGSLGKHKTIMIAVNGGSLEAWDPFCRNEQNTIRLALSKELSELHIKGFERPILIKGFVLPNKESFSSEKAWDRAKGLLSWNDSQGYYIYRADRLIRFGGWHGTKAKDEHDKLARVSIDIDPALDKLFRITVNKSKVQFPEHLYNHLKSKVNRIIINAAQKQYRKTNSKHVVKNKFRKQEQKLSEVSRNLAEQHHIRTQAKPSDDIAVVNPTGGYLSNKVQDFLKYGKDGDFEIVSDVLGNDHLWKIVCNAGEKFKVIINTAHPFYTRIYDSGSNKAVTSAVDALICSLAFAELYNRNELNANLFETFKSVCSMTLARLSKGDLI